LVLVLADMDVILFNIVAELLMCLALRGSEGGFQSEMVTNLKYVKCVLGPMPGMHKGTGWSETLMVR